MHAIGGHDLPGQLGQMGFGLKMRLVMEKVKEIRFKTTNRGYIGNSKLDPHKMNGNLDANGNPIGAFTEYELYILHNNCCASF